MKPFLAILFFGIQLVFSQQYLPLDTLDYKKRNELKTFYENKYKEFNKSLKSEYKGNTRTEITSYYEEAQKEFIKLIEKKEFVFDTRFTNYADSIKAIILASNSGFSEHDLKFLITRLNTPNAANLGDGTTMINMGLFKYLENENQLLSVICHELAHQQLKHVQQSMEERVEMSTSKEKKQQAMALKRQKYDTYNSALSMMKEILYSASEDRQKKEIEADSLGFKIYKNLGALSRFYRCLEHIS